MNIRLFHIGLAIWIFAIARMGFAESFPNRPTSVEMGNLVISGTQCAHGVNERCWATQYSTNPVQYQVEPFANSTEFYLDQSLMGAMASKIKSLILCYADPDTVYDGTTSISMYTVPGLFAELDIGNHEDQFTQTFASGTNAAVYGDSPWRIYEDNLDERYTVLESLKCCMFSGKVNFYDCEIKGIGNGVDYDDSVDKFLAVGWVPDAGSAGIHAYMDSIDGTWAQSRVRGKFEVSGGFTTNLMAEKIEGYAYLSTPGGPFYGSDQTCPGVYNTFVQIITLDYPNLSTFPYKDTTLYGNSEAPIPDGSPNIFYGWFLGWSIFGNKPVFINFDFQYCTD